MPEPASMPSDLRLNQPQSLNPYVYCTNNPLRYVDKDGEAYYEVGTNNLLNYDQALVLYKQTLFSALRGENPTLPVYSRRNIKDDIKIFGFGKAISNISSIDYHYFVYGETHKDVTVTAWSLMTIASSFVNTDVPLNFVSSIETVSKTKSGEEILRFSIGGNLIINGKIKESPSNVYTIRGTLIEINNLLKEGGLEVYWNKSEKEYLIRDIKEEQ